MLASQIGNMMPGTRRRCGRHMRLRQTFSPNKKKSTLNSIYPLEPPNKHHRWLACKLFEAGELGGGIARIDSLLTHAAVCDVRRLARLCSFLCAIWLNVIRVVCDVFSITSDRQRKTAVPHTSRYIGVEISCHNVLMG